MVREIRAISETIVRVKFDSSVVGEPYYLDPDNYVFTGDLEALGVVVFQNDTIDIITTPQKTDCFYELEVIKNA